MLFGWFKKGPRPDADLAERVETLERGFKHIRLDWDETFEKLGRMSGKLAKRQKTLEALEEAAQDTPGTTNGGSPGAPDLAAERARDDGRRLREWRARRGA